MPPLGTGTEEELPDDDVLPMTRAEEQELHNNDDGDYIPSTEDNDDENEDVVEAVVVQEEKKGEVDKSLIPDDWFFPGFIAFVAWGPFADKESRLRTVLLKGLSKKDVKSRATMRKEKTQMKNKMRDDDSANKRGLTTDQLISLESVKVQKDNLLTKRQEVTLASYAMRNSILDTQIGRYERMAERKCPDYDATDPSWKKVDDLLEEQAEILKAMKDLTTTMHATPAEDLFQSAIGVNDTDDVEVIDAAPKDNRLGKEVAFVSEDIHSAMTTNTTRDNDGMLKSPNKSPTANNVASKPTSKSTSKKTSTTTSSKTTNQPPANPSQSKPSTSFCRRLPSKLTSDKGKFQFDGNPIWFCAAGMGHCLAPHVEVGKETLHYCSICKERVHVLCVSTNTDGVMVCAGCDDNHSYTDAIVCAHEVDPTWKKELVRYYHERDGIPRGMSFLASEGYMERQALLKNANRRQSKNSSGTVGRGNQKKKKSAPPPSTRSKRRKRVSK